MDETFEEYVDEAEDAEETAPDEHGEDDAEASGETFATDNIPDRNNNNAPDPNDPPEQPVDGRDDELRQEQAGEQDWAGGLRQVYAQWEPKLQQWANTPGHIGGVFAKNPLLAAHAMFSFLDKLETDPRATISHLRQTYGVESYDLDPGLKKFVGETAYQAQSMKLQAMLDDFTKDKSHYAELRPYVIQEIQRIRQVTPTLPPDQTLRLAYHNAMDATGYNTVLEQRREAERQARQAEQEAKRKAEHKTKAEQARKSTAGNVRSQYVSHSNPKTVDDTLNEIAGKYYR